MKKIILFICLGLFFGDSKTQNITGFLQSNIAHQISIEKKFDELIQAQDQDNWMKFLSSHPHHVGSPQDKANAYFMADLFKSWGYETEIAQYKILFPTPKFRLLELKGNQPFIAKLQEPVLKEDNTSNQTNEQLPTYNAYSADGDVTAPLVFVNRGVPADYEELARRHIDVKGKIVIAKYGGSWRGIKPKVAAEHGAIGCIIYSDPADDGYTAGDVYPTGAFKPEDGVQRGSVMDMPVYPGDPLTPGIGATENAKRLPISEAKTIMKIPVLPISYADALPFLKALSGDVVPASWRGSLPITYHFGPSKAPVHLQLSFNWDLKLIYDVIATWPGVNKEEWIIRGNHHDGWVNGAADPLSGMVAELSEAKAIATLIKNGDLTLKRTIKYCAWDGEEPSLIGSTEWVEDHQDELNKKAMFYVNTDGNSRGFLSAQGSHVLEPFLNEVANSVIDPQTGVNVNERRYANEMVNGDNKTRQKILNDKYMKIGALGAGSDWGGFLQYLGISSINLAYGGEGNGGEYHSIYDSYDMFVRFKDPGFKYGVALSKTAGRCILRLSNADILPINFNSFSNTLAEYVDEVKTLLDNERNETNMLHSMLNQNLYKLANDPKLNIDAPPSLDDVPFLNFSILDNAMVQLKNASKHFMMDMDNAKLLTLDQQKQLNSILYTAERSLTLPEGLPRRAWYKHQIYAPGFYTGYGVKTLPGIREAIEQKNFKEAEENIIKVSKTIEAYVHKIEAANNLLESVKIKKNGF